MEYRAPETLGTRQSACKKGANELSWEINELGGLRFFQIQKSEAQI